MVRAGITRVPKQKPLTPGKFSVNTNTLVVGGGIAGMQASLDIAKAGFKVYLVEKGSTVGNHMLQYDKTFPTLDCAACIGTPKMVSVGQHPNIELITHAEVKEVNGFVGNFKVKVDKKPDTCRRGSAPAAATAPKSVRLPGPMSGMWVLPTVKPSIAPFPSCAHHLYYRQERHSSLQGHLSGPC